MKIDILTLFPEMFQGPFDESMIKRARENKLIEINIHYLRDWAHDKHNKVDDRPFGGGAGMLLKVDVMDNALKDLKSKNAKVILLSPQGKSFNQVKAKRLSKEKHLILIAGHYEGFDERIREHLIDEEISIGDYVLTGGELPAMVLTDTICRLVDGVIEKESLAEESHSIKNYIEYPQYTKPATYNGWSVPEVLTSGNHQEVDKWRQSKSKAKSDSRK